MKHRVSMLLCGLVLAAGCAEEPQPRSVPELIDDPIILESILVRCAQNRAQSRYEAECVNARQAVSIIEAREERKRQDAFEAESARKRDALRRRQQAAAEARRRAAEADRLRREAEYLAQFGELPPDTEASAIGNAATNAPTAVIPEATTEPAPDPAVTDRAPDPVEVAAPPPAHSANAPVADTAPPEDLNAIREELRRRNEESGN